MNFYIKILILLWQMEAQQKDEELKINEKKEERKLTDIILICGYLGSGKTTLISYILHK